MPRYDDGDVFVLTGAEDLVRYATRVVDPDSGRVAWVPEEPSVRADHRVFRYRPRTEGMFARIERWVHTTTGETHWRTITKDNVTSMFGDTAATRLSDPDDEQRVYEWLLHETYDALGNHTLCEYAADDPSLYDDDNADLRLPEIFEQRRRPTNRYLRRVYYGNLPEPLVDSQQQPSRTPMARPSGISAGAAATPSKWCSTTATGPRPPFCLIRNRPPDSWSSSARTSRRRRRVGRCRSATDRFSTSGPGSRSEPCDAAAAVLMFHHFAELGGPTLVRSTDFTYDTDPDTVISLLAAATVTGYDKDAPGGYRSASMPPVTFAYSQFRAPPAALPIARGPGRRHAAAGL